MSYVETDLNFSFAANTLRIFYRGTDQTVTIGIVTMPYSSISERGTIFAGRLSLLFLLSFFAVRQLRRQASQYRVPGGS